MAKKSVEARNEKRRRKVEKYAAKRAELKAIIKNPESTSEQVEEAQVKLQKMPRDSSPVRVRNRCGLTGRPNGYYRKFGLSRTKIRENMGDGNIPGLVKSSW